MSGGERWNRLEAKWDREDGTATVMTGRGHVLCLMSEFPPETRPPEWQHMNVHVFSSRKYTRGRARPCCTTLLFYGERRGGAASASWTAEGAIAQAGPLPKG